MPAAAAERSSIWSWRLGTVAGIQVRMHATFLLLIGWIAYAQYSAGGGLSAVLVSIAFVLALFACVVLHEFGHALTARRFGIATRDITLLPIGGVARLERMPDDAKEELLVALAGPAVNVVIAGVLYVVVGLLGASEDVSPMRELSGGFFRQLMVINIFLVGFNMLPAFPMDGGRVLRALLATRLDYVRATRIAASLGQAMALLFGFVGLFSNPLLLLIALFVWAGAGAEVQAVELRSGLGEAPVSAAMLTDFRTLAPSDPLMRAVELIMAGSQQDFPVMDNGYVTGVLTRRDVMSALADQRRDTPVGDMMQPGLEPVDASDSLQAVFARLQQPSSQTLPVTHNGRLVGLLTRENVSEFLMIRSALGDTQRRTPLARPIAALSAANAERGGSVTDS